MEKCILKVKMEEIAKEINYRKEYERLKEVERENQELKETIITMSKFMFQRDNALTETIKKNSKRIKNNIKRKVSDEI